MVKNYVITALLSLLGLLVYVGTFAYIFIRLADINIATRDTPAQAIARGLFGSIISLFIIFQFHSAFLEPLLWMLFGIVESIHLLEKKLLWSDK